MILLLVLSFHLVDVAKTEQNVSPNSDNPAVRKEKQSTSLTDLGNPDVRKDIGGGKALHADQQSTSLSVGPSGAVERFDAPETPQELQGVVRGEFNRRGSEANHNNPNSTSLIDPDQPKVIAIMKLPENCAAPNLQICYEVIKSDYKYLKYCVVEEGFAKLWKDSGVNPLEVEIIDDGTTCKDAGFTFWKCENDPFYAGIVDMYGDDRWKDCAAAQEAIPNVAGVLATTWMVLSYHIKHPQCSQYGLPFPILR